MIIAGGVPYVSIKSMAQHHPQTRMLGSDELLLRSISRHVNRPEQCMGLAVYLLHDYYKGGGVAFYEQQCHNSCLETAHSVLRMWCQCAGAKATGAVLYEVLRKIGMPNVAMEFQAKLLEEGKVLLGMQHTTDEDFFSCIDH